MPEKNEHKCPICNQSFTPGEGLTPEEHLANGVIEHYRAMQENPPDNIKVWPCPRCGQTTMKPELTDNPLSRFADIYICEHCATEEKESSSIRPVTDWFFTRAVMNLRSFAKCDDFIPDNKGTIPMCINHTCDRRQDCNLYRKR